MQSGLHVLGFLDKRCLTGEGVSLTPNHRLVDQASAFMSPETGRSSYTPIPWVSILIASYDSVDNVGAILVRGHHTGKRGKIIHVHFRWFFNPSTHIGRKSPKSIPSEHSNGAAQIEVSGMYQSKDMGSPEARCYRQSLTKVRYPEAYFSG